jgi:hypothetical protein
VWAAAEWEASAVSEAFAVAEAAVPAPKAKWMRQKDTLAVQPDEFAEIGSCKNAFQLFVAG